MASDITNGITEEMRQAFEEAQLESEEKYGKEEHGKGKNGRVLSFRHQNGHSDAPRQPAAPQQQGEGLRRPLKYTPGDEHGLAIEAMRIIQGDCYRMGKLLVKPIKLSVAKAHKGFNPAQGATTLEPLDLDSLTAMLNQRIAWTRHSRREKEDLPITTPATVAKQLLNIHDDWTFPAISGLVACPTMRFDGTIISEPGYDQKTMLYADFNKDGFLPIPERPGKEDALEALAEIDELLCDFPFDTEISKSVARGAMLTTVMRPSARTAPLFAFSAPSAGTGKTTLANIVSIIATGKPAPAFNYKHDDNELSKALFAMFLRGCPVILIDNVTGAIDSDMLHSSITSDEISDRILGQTKDATANTCAIIMITGNNLVIKGDGIRRTLYATLDANIEDPQNRPVKHSDIIAYALQERGKIVRALLTILRAWHIAKETEEQPSTFGSFEDWSGMVRGAILWLGCADPLDCQQSLKENDPDREAAISMLAAWHEAFSDDAMTTSEVIKAIQPSDQESQQKDEPRHKLENKQKEKLREALEAALPARAQLSARALGKWLTKNTKGIFGGYQIQRGETYQGARDWRIVKTGKPSALKADVKASQEEECQRGESW